MRRIPPSDGAGSPGFPLVKTGPGIGPSPARRLLDVGVALMALTMLSPLLLCVAAAVRVSTGGSAIFRQRRVGQGGVPFTLLKFRTMRASMTGPEVTAPGDARVTPLGALLRRTSVDELPQLLNVLRGSMTLVGPRPESLPLAMRYPPECRSVFRYRPGLTGPSQVLVHDDRVLDQVADVEGFYLRELVPKRVATDMRYLTDPTLRRTIAWICNTVRYIAGVTLPAAPPDRLPTAVEPRT
jgi:lipopolysaccharide/colanic/teichoic acid biosynthesis glycosyltransferase